MSQMPNWMSYIPDNTSLSELWIPGTRDSCSDDLASPHWVKDIIGDKDVLCHGVAEVVSRKSKYYITQSKNHSQQLYGGVRFIDLKLAVDSEGELAICIGGMVTHATLYNVVGNIYNFLAQYRKETVLVSVRANSSEENKDHVNELLGKVLDDYASTFELGCQIPKLGAVRGKAVLINGIGPQRPSRPGQPFGIHIKYPDNEAKSISAPQIIGNPLSIAIQNVDDPPTESSKTPLVSKYDHVKRAYIEFSKKKHDLRFNFTSASKAPKYTPQNFAEDINPYIKDMLYSEAQDARWITVMDYFDQYCSEIDDPVASMVSMNSLLGLRPSNAKSQMEGGEKFKPGTVLWSLNGAYNARFQDDGNLVVYRTIDGFPMRASGTHHKGATHATMQTDGNLVVYKGSKPLASTETHGNVAGCQLIMQNDGNLAIYDGRHRKILWGSLWNDFKSHF